MQVRKQSVHSAEQSSSAYMKERVVRAMNMQRRRFADEEYSYNSEIPAGDMEKYCGLGQEERDFVSKIFQEFSLTARGTHKLLKLSRTIADLDESDEIRIDHLATASIFKSL